MSSEGSDKQEDTPPTSYSGLDTEPDSPPAHAVDATASPASSDDGTNGMMPDDRPYQHPSQNPFFSGHPDYTDRPTTYHPLTWLMRDTTLNDAGSDTAGSDEVRSRVDDLMHGSDEENVRPTFAEPDDEDDSERQPYDAACPHCHAGFAKQECKCCSGTGKSRSGEDCAACSGRGDRHLACRECSGSGKATDDEDEEE